MLQPETLRSILHYDPITGKIYWLARPVSDFKDSGRGGAAANATRWNARYAGKEAMTALAGCGYPAGTILGQRVAAHRVVWAWMTGAWPTAEIDHRDGDKTNNRWANLRQATRSENQRNIGATGASGFKGVTAHKKTGKWQAQIKVGDTNRYLGLFDRPEDAHAAYCDVARATHGEFWRAA